MRSQFGFTVPGVPIPQGSLTHVGKGRLIHKPELVAWRREVLDEALKAARQAGWAVPHDGPVLISATFHMLRPKRPKFEVPATKPDLDKLCRAIGDALAPLNGPRVLTEDSRIIKWVAEKKYAPPGKESAQILIISQHVPF